MRGNRNPFLNRKIAAATLKASSFFGGIAIGVSHGVLFGLAGVATSGALQYAHTPHKLALVASLGIAVTGLVSFNKRLPRLYRHFIERIPEDPEIKHLFGPKEIIPMARENLAILMASGLPSYAATAGIIIAKSQRLIEAITN